MTNELTTQQQAAIGKTVKGGVSGRLKAALDDMLWNGTDWDKAAVKANLTVRAMRLALKRPQVLKYLRAERGVLLASMSAKNLQRLGALRDQDDNRSAAVRAAHVLEGLTSEQFGEAPRGSMGAARAGYMIDLRDDQSPGVVIQIVQQAPVPIDPQVAGVTIDVTPNDE